ncbi:hypothetical protein GCM10027343_42920 [Noviherbaspirillum agri]
MEKEETMKLKKMIVLLGWTAFIATSLVQAADDHKGHDHKGKQGSQHVDEAKPMYGGVLGVANDISYELVAKPDRIVLYVSDHGTAVDTKGASASITLLSASGKTDVALNPTGENKLEATGAFQTAPGTKAVARVALKGKPAQNVRFTLK